VATRKISDLTLLSAGQVSSSDTLLLLDNSDPTDQNKRSAVGSIFTAVPSGTYTLPGIRFEGKTSTGVFSETQGQVGLAMGNSRLNLEKVGTTLNIQAKDDADQNLDFKISAQGTGKITLGSVLAIDDLNFVLPNSINDSKVAKFSSANLTAGLTNTYSFPPLDLIENLLDEIVTLKTVQTLENKTLVSPTFTGTLSIASFTASGSATLGDDAADSLTVNAAATFAASTTFSNTVIASQGITSGSGISATALSLTDDGTAANTILSVRTDDATPWAFVLGNDTYASSSSTGTGFYVADTGEHHVWFRGNQEFKSVYFKQDDTQGNSPTAIEFTPTREVKLHHDGTERLTTSATGISIGGAIDAVTSITGSGDIAIATDKFTLDSATGNAVFGGNITGGGNITATTGNTFQLGSSVSAKLGVGRAASTYNLEVEGSIYSTGSTIIAGDGTVGKFIIQKSVPAISLNFTDSTGTDEAILSGAGNFGLGKVPTYKLDVSGSAWFDGDITINTTDAFNEVGGKISARELVLTDPSTGSTTTLNAISGGGGLSRGRVYFLAN
jgi:hypothetical protein